MRAILVASTIAMVAGFRATLHMKSGIIRFKNYYVV
jgi:hypothetical protein